MDAIMQTSEDILGHIGIKQMCVEKPHQVTRRWCKMRPQQKSGEKCGLAFRPNNFTRKALP